ncbi:MAG: glycerophosphodiester phosphodiesterase [Bacteroidota bacterium]
MAPGVKVIARRGDSENAPENTLPAFESAIASGADGIELDVHQTADGQLIVHHFFNLGTTDNGTGLVGEKSLSELKALDSGAWFHARFSGIHKPQLAEVLELCKGRIHLEIDMKHSSLDFLHRVIREVEDFGSTDQVELTTAHYPLLLYAKTRSPRIRTGTFFYEPPTWMPLRLAQQHALDWSSLLKIDMVHLNLALITPEFVEELHRRGFEAYGSNLDTERDILRGIECGIDSFSTGHLRMALQTRDEAMNAARGGKS